ncbi:MAG: tRNA (adenosine(37)-N6)-threonylcarbamoyltransferase complex dimerization subunit type 1 TsaB [Planctomycetaceae bacterium]|nr:tRNA (adenosine(37)-N6)-threonylcarbamoyltransferase complex dimerization subunit type 1 TsaB [Planctomycetaceae bacterium]
MTQLLAIETTEKRGSIALSLDGKILLQYELPDGQRSAQSLTPTIQTALWQVDWPIKSLDAVAVALGPGSFTGLRIGLATGRMLAYAVDAKLLGVNTLQAIAANVCLTGDDEQVSKWQNGQLVTTAVDAQRGEVSAQTFRMIPSRHFVGELFPEPVDERRLLTFDAWWTLADTQGGHLAFAGPVLSKIAAQRPEAAQLLDESLWSPNAGGVSRIAWERLFSGKSDDMLTLQPYYSRPSAAEEKLGVRN